MTEYTVVMVNAALNANSVLDELAMKRDMELRLAKFIYDAKRDIYSKCRGERATIKVHPDQYLGIFSADGRIEMFSARVKEVEKKTAEYFPDIKVGARVCICFDSLIEVGCVRSVRNGGFETRYAMSGYLGGHDFDGDPVEPLSDADMQTAIARMTAEDEAESGTATQVAPESAEVESEAETEAEMAQATTGANPEPEAGVAQTMLVQTTENAATVGRTGNQAMSVATLTTGQIAGQAEGNASSVDPAGQKKAKGF